ncbi:hypothetical protein NMY22_g10955 [Coprinellus aureogranulatus]|nr:hypothetical protein NMY22_g10955 [Coprinellus aureogranulatus]
MRPSASPSTSSPSPIQSLSTWQSTSGTRLQALYSDFSRQKTSNPTSFQANVEWWRRALEEFVDSGFQDESSSNTTKSRLVLHANASLLEKVKVPKVGKPLALGAVLVRSFSLFTAYHTHERLAPVKSDLHNASHSIYPLSEFLSLKSSIYATSSLPVRVASYLVGKPLWWSLEQIGIKCWAPH